MLLFIVFGVALAGYTFAYYLRTKSLSPLLTIMGMIGHLFKDHRLFSIALLGVVALHLWGHITLGTVVYNTSGFDMLTHTLFGFFVIGTMDEAKLFAGRAKRILLLFSVALTFHLVHEFQEEIQMLIPGLASHVSTEFVNQVRDLGFNLLGMLSYLVIAKRIA